MSKISPRSNNKSDFVSRTRTRARNREGIPQERYNIDETSLKPEERIVVPRSECFTGYFNTSFPAPPFLDNKTDVFVVFPRGTWKFEEIARIRVRSLIPVQRRGRARAHGGLSFQSRFARRARDGTRARAVLLSSPPLSSSLRQPSRNFGRKVFQDDSTKTGRKIRPAALAVSETFPAKVTGR